jgi:hypothetical protein
MLQQALAFARTAVRTESLRSRNRDISITPSLFSRDGQDSRNKDPADGADDISIIAPSGLEFAFDDLVINSRAYRRIIAEHSGLQPVPGSDTGEVGDQISLASSTTSLETSRPTQLVSSTADLAGHELAYPQAPTYDRSQLKVLWHARSKKASRGRQVTFVPVLSVVRPV